MRSLMLQDGRLECAGATLRRMHKAEHKELASRAVGNVPVNQNDNVLFCQLSVNALSPLSPPPHLAEWIPCLLSVICPSASVLFLLLLLLRLLPGPFVFSRSHSVSLSAWTRAWVSKYCEKGPPQLMSLHKRTSRQPNSGTGRDGGRETYEMSHLH